MSHPESETRRRSRTSWWPALVVLVIALGAIAWVRSRADSSFQERNLQTLAIIAGAAAMLLLWWLTGSPTRWKARLLGVAIVLFAIGLGAAFFRFHGVSGDLYPILELRWARHAPSNTSRPRGPEPRPEPVPSTDFPQFLGPNRTAVLEGLSFQTDWATHAPTIIWRQPVGAAWSGWAVVGTRALTQEQRSEGECSTCYDRLTGQLLWSVGVSAHYQTAIAGEGPRCTPTVVSNRVLTLGATGLLNCLDLETGRRLWSHNIVEDAKSRVPEWGFAGSPLVFDGKVVVSAGGSPGHSLLAYSLASGELIWSGGDQPVSYSSPVLVSLSGVRQVLCFDHRRITSHDPLSGRQLWDYHWGNGQPQVAVPVVVGLDRVVFSSGYGVGAEMLELNRDTSDAWSVTRVWQSRKMKAKFANLVQRDGFLYGLDDGVLACLDLKDGSQCWKEGRYGHGQGLLVGDLFLLMAENGELVLLRPTPKSPGQLGRFKLFRNKTWNPIALSGGLLLARNDREAACVRLPLDR